MGLALQNPGPTPLITTSSPSDNSDPDLLSTRHFPLIQSQHLAALRHEIGRGHNLGRRAKRATQTRAIHGGWGLWNEDVVGLARSPGRMPCDTDRRRQVPRDGDEGALERKLAVKWTGGDAADVEELYRIGLLYDDDDDDERERGSGFGLEMIQREPVVRWEKRARRRRKGRDVGGEWETDLVGDEVLAKWSMAPGEAKVVELVEIGMEPGAGKAASLRDGAATRSSSPLPVIPKSDPYPSDPASNPGEEDDSWSTVSDVWDHPTSISSLAHPMESCGWEWV